MSHARIGELLGRMVKLTGHDVEEILQEQSVTRWRFGDIALSWGLCQPEHIWRAWRQQLGEKPKRVDVREIGVDAQAIAYLSPALAWEYQAVPIRLIGDELLLAVAESGAERAMRDLPQACDMQVKFVLSDADQVREAIEQYYPALQAVG